MKDYQVQVFNSDGEIEEEILTFSLSEKATALDLKSEFAKSDIYNVDQLRLTYKSTEDGIEHGIEDDDGLETIIQTPGIFLVNVPTMNALTGKITILRDFDESVFILLGSMNKFDHFHVHRKDGDNFRLPKGKLSFLFAQNKVALIEKETRETYEATQYLVQDGWKLLIAKNPNPLPNGPKLMLKRVKDSGEQVTLRGTSKIYLDKFAKQPKIYDD